MQNINITDIEGIKIGHEQNFEAATGCTVILCEDGAGSGVDVRGGAPGTRETDLLNPMNLVDKVHAVVLAGGSAFGLDAAAGVMEYLEEKECGFDVGVTKVPIVTGAVLFDLHTGDYRIRPDKEMGKNACISATNHECPEGNIGAGTGATVGKYFGMLRAMKSGIGTCCFQAGELKVGAIVAVNCFGDVYDPATGKIIAGTLHEDEISFADTEKLMIQSYNHNNKVVFENTTIGAIITNVTLSKAQGNKVASMAQNGFARTIRPAHTMYDGDTVFTVATGKTEADINTVGLLAARAMESAVIRAIKETGPLAGLKAYSDLKGNN